MKQAALAAAAVTAAAFAALGAAFAGSGPSADNTDLYAFRSPDRPDTVTIVSNWIPGEDPAAGPNYYTFSPTAKYKLNIDQVWTVLPRKAGPAVRPKRNS